VFAFKKEWLIVVLWRLGMLATQLVQPFLVRAFVAYLSNTTQQDLRIGLLLAFLIGFAPIVEMLFVERAIWLNSWTNQRIRTSLVLLVNRKLLFMRRGSGIDINTLLAVDVDRIGESAESLHL
jgi:hypothetical protein